MRAEALWPDLSTIASAGEGPAIHDLIMHRTNSWMPGTSAGHDEGGIAVGLKLGSELA